MCDNIDLTEKLILEKLNSLDPSKSPGPDLLHPRVLYEVRHEIVYPLKLIFERSLKDHQLPRDWKSSTTRIWHVPAKHANRMDARAHSSSLAERAPRFMTRTVLPSCE